jgi:hypothetical protein
MDSTRHGLVLIATLLNAQYLLQLQLLRSLYAVHPTERGQWLTDWCNCLHLCRS